MSYSKFKKRVEKTTDCTKFVEKVEQIMVYAKLAGVNVKINTSVVFNWLAMINDDSNYEPYHVEQEVATKGEFDEVDLEYVVKQLYELHKIFEEIVEDFEDKKQYIISLIFDEDTRKADLSIYKNERDVIDFSMFDYYGNFGGR